MELLEKHKVHYIAMESISDIIIHEYISPTTKKYTTDDKQLLFKAFDLTSAIAQTIEFSLYGYYVDTLKYNNSPQDYGYYGSSGLTGKDERFEAAKDSLKELPPEYLPLLIDFFHTDSMQKALSEILSELK